jgi:predicted TIM-barrel fold metal-dependent hydrolase
MRPSRREVLAALAALGAANRAAAQLRTPPDAPRLLDIHHHVLPDFWKKATNTQNPWTLDASLAAMDKNGVTAAIVSYTAPAASVAGTAAARALARQCNEYAAKLRETYPDRFRFFAAINPPDVEGSLREIEYAFDTLKAQGAGLLTSYGDKWPGDPAYAPVLEELNRRKAVVYLHPAGPNCCASGLVPGVRPAIIEFPHDSTRAALSLLYSGSFRKFRDINWIFSHGGGTIPYLAGRIEQMTANEKGRPAFAPNGALVELQRLYFEIANSANPVSMAALMKFVPLEQILFGTDYPFVPVEATSDRLPSLQLTASQYAAITRANAEKLLRM